MHLAAQWGQKETLELLLAHGADATARDQHGSTPLHIMAGHSTRTEIAELLLTHGANLNAQDE
ncbi:MAG: ankyrin repeat domain-containing protein, partial [Anaerolineales bacterium]